jgi:hypothetical protein
VGREYRLPTDPRRTAPSIWPDVIYGRHSLLRRHRRALETVAARLSREGRIEGREVEEIIVRTAERDGKIGAVGTGRRKTSAGR